MKHESLTRSYIVYTGNTQWSNYRRPQPTGHTRFDAACHAEPEGASMPSSRLIPECRAQAEGAGMPSGGLIAHRAAPAGLLRPLLVRYVQSPTGRRSPGRTPKKAGKGSDAGLTLHATGMAVGSRLRGLTSWIVPPPTGCTAIVAHDGLSAWSAAPLSYRGQEAIIAACLPPVPHRHSTPHLPCERSTR